MADVEQVPSFRQAPTESGRIRVDIPGLANTQVEFPPDASMDEIAQRVDEIRSQYRQDITAELPQTVKYLPESLSTGLGYLGGAMKRPLSIAASPAGQGAGQLAGRLVQDVTRGYLESQNPPQVSVKARGQQRQFPVTPLPPDLTATTKEFLQKEAPWIFGIGGAMEAVVPGLGKAAHALSEKTRLGPVQGIKKWLSEKALYPDKANPETQEMLQIEQRIKKMGGEGLPISRMHGVTERPLIPETMEAVASGGGSKALKSSLEESNQAMQRYADKWAGTHGFPDSYVAGESIKRALDGAEEYFIGNVQDKAYGAVRHVISPKARFVPADNILKDLQRPDNKLGGLIMERLRTVSASRPQQGGNLSVLIGEGSAKQVGGLTFDEAITLRTELNTVGRKFAGSMDPDAARMGQAAINNAKILSQQIKQAVGTFNPQLRRGLEQADRSVSKIKDYYNDPQYLRFYSQLEDNPQVALRELLKPNNASMVMKIRSVLEPQRARLGRMSAITGDWKQIQDWFSAELIRESTANVKGAAMYVDGKKLTSMLDNYDKRTIDSIFTPNTWNELRLMARGLSETETKPTGMGKIAIQLALPGAAIGLVGGAAGMAYTGEADKAAAMAGAGAILMTPRAFGVILTNPSLRRHFVDGVWEYRKYGNVMGVPMGDRMRALIRQAEALAARQTLPGMAQGLGVDNPQDISIQAPATSQSTP